MVKVSAVGFPTAVMAPDMDPTEYTPVELSNEYDELAESPPTVPTCPINAFAEQLVGANV
jgi:hypothetical protein